MVKSFVYLLILANVVLLLWETGFRGGDDSRRELAIPSGLEQIVLSDEVLESDAAAEPAPAEADLQSAEADADLVADEPAVPEVKPSAVKDCYLVGPEPSKARAEYLLGFFKAHAMDATLEAKPGEVPDGWWILFPKAASLEAARENRRALAEKGVKDMWVFEKGSLEWAISLGLYSSRDRAEVARKQFADKSIVTEVTPRLVQGEVHWLRIPWRRPLLELEEIVQLFNTQDPDSDLPEPIPCP
jgi:hypothetical protein